MYNNLLAKSIHPSRFLFSTHNYSFMVVRWGIEKLSTILLDDSYCNTVFMRLFVAKHLNQSACMILLYGTQTLYLQQNTKSIIKHTFPVRPPTTTYQKATKVKQFKRGSKQKQILKKKVIFFIEQNLFFHRYVCDRMKKCKRYHSKIFIR